MNTFIRWLVPTIGIALCIVSIQLLIKTTPVEASPVAVADSTNAACGPYLYSHACQLGPGTYSMCQDSNGNYVTANYIPTKTQQVYASGKVLTGVTGSMTVCPWQTLPPACQGTTCTGFSKAQK